MAQPDYIIIEAEEVKPLSLHCVFHGIRFKVNEDWVSGKIPFFFCVCIPSFFFCPNKRKTKQKENSPSAFFCLLRHFSPLNKKNSLTLKQLFVFNAPKSTSASRQKKEAGIFRSGCILNIASLVAVTAKRQD